MKFQEKVWHLIAKIPEGKVTTYKILAEKLGTKAYRAVGTACARNPYSPLVPCHRVVNSDGCVWNFSGKGGIKEKIVLLTKEGIKISDKRVANLDKHLYKF